MVIKRGDIFYADPRPVVGSEQGGIRPVLIIQNDVGNRHTVLPRDLRSDYIQNEQGEAAHPY